MSLGKLSDDVAWDALFESGAAEEMLADAHNQAQMSLTNLETEGETQSLLHQLGEMPEREFLTNELDRARRRGKIKSFRSLVERQQRRRNYRSLKQLRSSIYLHRAITLGNGLVPTENDLILWSKIPQTGKS